MKEKDYMKSIGGTSEHRVGKALSYQEISSRDLSALVQHGDEEALQELMSRSGKFVAAVCKQYQEHHPDVDDTDLSLIAWEGLRKGLMHSYPELWDTNKASAFLMAWTRNEINKELQKGLAPEVMPRLGAL